MFSWFVCFQQMTAYEMRIRYWSSDVCSSDLICFLSMSSPYIFELRKLQVFTALNSDAIMAGCGSFSAADHCWITIRRFGPVRVPEFAPDRAEARSEERRVGKSVAVRVDLGGGRILKKKKRIFKAAKRI